MKEKKEETKGVRPGTGQVILFPSTHSPYQCHADDQYETEHVF
ncbi:MAG: hypothetical protein ACI9HK_005664 [Pirellulaceae bacterium]|jgi:hypothetical protein